MVQSAEILSVGTELLLGQIVNSDAQYLSQQLSPMGINVYRHVTVGDNVERLKAALAECLQRADMVITTGGLGPTMDDLTKETVAEFFGLPMERDEATYAWLKDHFEKRGAVMSPNNAKQADFPKGSRILPNRNGTAPGCVVEENGKVVIVLPGPPVELHDMFENAVLPYLHSISEDVIVSKILRFFGIGESALEYQLRELIAAQTNPTIAPYAGMGEVTLRLTAKCRAREEAEGLIAPVEAAIMAQVGEYFYGYGKDTLDIVVARKLLERGRTLALAESCTGGMIAAKLVGYPGISEALLEGQVVYSNAAKVRRLGVKEQTLEQFGAVSEETAREMALGLRAQVGSDLALSVTGIAGPDGGTDEKPVGLVYIGLAQESGVTVKKLNLSGDRNRVRNMSTLNALDMIRRALDEMDT